MDARTRTLGAELERLTEGERRPSSSLHARSLRLCMQLLLSTPDKLGGVLRDIQHVVAESKGLVGFPLEPLTEVLTQLGRFLGSRPEYGGLVDTIIEVTSTREGDVAAARILLKRGAQQLDADCPVEAIRTLGRALGRLFTHESRHEMVWALYLCGAAYERIGLLWAARGTVLSAAAIAINEYWTYADVTPLQAACHRRMKWLELQLGRIPHALAWHEIHCAVNGVLAEQGYDAESLSVGEPDFDGILGILLLKTDVWELKWLSKLPDVLESLGLYASAVALRFALGHEEGLPSELVGEDADRNALLEFFVRWRDEPAGEELPASPLLCNARTVALNSVVLGCRITTDTDNELPCIALSESALAALESLLSTGAVDRICARDPVLTMRVRKSDFVGESFEFDSDDRDGRPHVQVRCGGFDPNSMSPEMQLSIRNKLSDLVASVVGRSFVFADGEQGIATLMGRDRAMERAVAFTSSFVTLGNVLGDAPRTSVAMWSDSSARDYPLLRSEQWDARMMHEHGDSPPAEASASRTVAEEHPVELMKAGRARHSEMGLVTPIREMLWNEAEWTGTAFCWTEGDVEPPVLAPIFTNAEAAGKIFALWRKDMGESDAQDLLRVTIVRGISRRNPHAYRVILGANPPTKLPASSTRYVFMMYRIHAMEPSSDHNLSAFLNSYKTVGTYILAHAVAQPGSRNPDLVWDNAITKRHLQVREAWEVGRHDVDGVGILPSDDPIIPSDRPDAPVLELIRWKRER